MLNYPQWLERRIAGRAAEYPTAGSSILFSLLTTVYEKSDPSFLAAAARSIFDQSYRSFEWIILAQGPTPPDIDKTLAEIASYPQCRLLRHEHNLGIVPGLRRCLETATGDYLIPVDADDLLTPDALHVMAHSIWRHNRPALVYSDEDLLIDGIPSTPFMRPDWDPVLGLSSSYIWHLCAIDRAAALKIGIYTDVESNWCHDWDTVTRVAAASRRIVHVPEVLYHWRQHAASTTNRTNPDSASLRSQRHVLERWVQSRADPELFTVEKLPIEPGAPGYWLGRRPVSPPVLGLLAFGGNPSLLLNSISSAVDSAADAVAEIHVVGIPDLPGQLSARVRELSGAKSTRIIVWPQAKPYDLLLSLSNSRVTYLAVVSQHVTLEAGWIWEADRLLRLHPEAAIAAARILDESGRVLSAGEAFGFGGISGSPDAGRSKSDPGPYGIALKPRSVSAPHPWFFVARRTDLVDALRKLPAEANWGVLGTWLGGIFAESGQLVAFSPYLNAVRQTCEPIHATIPSIEASAFTHRFIRFIPDFRGYSKWYNWGFDEPYHARVTSA